MAEAKGRFSETGSAKKVDVIKITKESGNDPRIKRTT